MIEVLKHFSLSVAVEKNRSFRFFVEHYLIANPVDAGLAAITNETSIAGERVDSPDPPGNEQGPDRSREKRGPKKLIKAENVFESDPFPPVTRSNNEITKKLTRHTFFREHPEFLLIVTLFSSCSANHM